MITYNSENIKMPAIRRRDTSAWIRRVAATYGKRVGEVGYLFCDDEHILQVNREYLQHDYYTDIITFDYCEGDTLNGDLVISLDTIRTNSVINLTGLGVSKGALPKRSINSLVPCVVVPYSSPFHQLVLIVPRSFFSS